MTYIVYRHISPSGKSYIGLTSQSLERRARNGSGYVQCSAFYEAIKKYGWDSFRHEILETGLSFDEACEKERRYICLFDSLTTGNGYNLESGGRVNTNVSLETKKKISNSLMGHTSKPMSEEQKKKISLSRTGVRCPPRTVEHRKRLSESLTGRTFTSEHCFKISQVKRSSQFGKNNPKARKVVCIEKGVVFDTIKEAGSSVGGNPKNITSCCRGRLKTVAGYHWKYAEEV